MADDIIPSTGDASELYRAKIVIDVDDSAANEKAKGIEETFKKAFNNIDKVAQRFKNEKVDKTVKVKDEATTKLEKINSSLKKIGAMSVSAIVKIKDGTKTVLSGIMNRIRAVGRALASPLGMLGIGVSAAGLFEGLIKQPLEVSSEREQMQMGFATMLGSLDKAKTLMTELRNYANVTPFQTSTLADSTKMLLQYGVQMKDIVPDLKMLGDVSLGNTEKFMELSHAFAEIQGRGKLTGIELREMVNSGFNPLKVMSEKTGKSLDELQKEMEKGAISAADVSKAFQEATSKGGLFYNAMKTQSRTLQGLWSTLKDAFYNNILFPWGEGIRKVLEPKVAKLTDWLTDPKNTAKIEKWGKELERISGEATKWILDKFEGVGKFIQERYLDNPAFQKLSSQGKVDFVISYLGNALSKWFARETPAIVHYGLMIGTQLISAMAQGVTAAVAGHPLLGFLLGTYIGLKTGNLYIGLTVGISLAVVPPILKWLYEMGNKTSPYIPGTSSYTDRRLEEETKAMNWRQPKGHSYNITKPTNAPSGYGTLDWLNPDSGRNLSITVAVKEKASAFMKWLYSEGHAINKDIIAPVKEKASALVQWLYNKGLPINKLITTVIEEKVSAFIRWLYNEGHDIYKTIVASIRADIPPILQWIYNKWGQITSIFNGGAGSSAGDKRSAWNALHGEAYAEGGIITSPRFGLVGEAGPESIIPHKRDSNSAGLWLETGKRLGLIPHAGFNLVPATNAGSAVINLNFDTSNLVGQIIVNNKNEINNSIDNIANAFASEIKKTLQNLA
jgi:tape measure domain-containing protein